MNPGIHLFHKPIGPSSFSVVRECIQSIPATPGHRPPRVCHGGTLDPFASGLLLILVEPATRLFDYLHAIPKRYEATVRWGVETENGDPHGRETFTGDPSALSAGQLDDLLGEFIGWHEQIPPATSAKRIDGERAYVRAYRGETVVMPACRVYLHSARWLDHDLPRQSRVELIVRGGYYVRALARDIGRRVGCGAHVGALERTAIGPWVDPGVGQRQEIHGRDLLPWMPSRILSDQDVGDLRAGESILPSKFLPPDWPLPPGFPESPTPVRGFHLNRFCFLLERAEERLRVLVPLRGGL